MPRDMGPACFVPFILAIFLSVCKCVWRFFLIEMADIKAQHARARVCVCVCVCVRARARARMYVCVCEILFHFGKNCS